MLRYPDLYHTCYALAGLSVAQSYSKHRQTDDSAPKSAVTIRNQSFIVGGEENALVCLPAAFFGNIKYLFLLSFRRKFIHSTIFVCHFTIMRTNIFIVDVIRAYNVIIISLRFTFVLFFVSLF